MTRDVQPLDAPDAGAIVRASFFRNLTAAGKAQLLARARRRSLRKGQHLFRQDAPADAVYLVLSGRLRVLQTSSDGQSVALRVVGEGELVGLVAALGEGRYPVSAQAQQACVVARWPGQVLWPLLAEHPPLALEALRMALSRLHGLQEAYRELATERVERRIARALVRLVRQAGRRVEGGVRIDMPLTRQDLAELSGTTLFTVSRVMTGWADRGVLTSRRGQVTIRRPHALVAIAEDLPPTP